MHLLLLLALTLFSTQAWAGLEPGDIVYLDDTGALVVEDLDTGTRTPVPVGSMPSGLDRFGAAVWISGGQIYAGGISSDLVSDVTMIARVDPNTGDATIVSAWDQNCLGPDDPAGCCTGSPPGRRA